MRREFGRQRRRGKSSQPYRLVFLEGVLSADSHMLVVHVDGIRTANDLWYRGLTSDTAMRALATTPFTEAGPRISPDGRWIAFASDESGSYQVYVTPLPGPGGRYQVSTTGGATSVWSPDGRRLYYAYAGRLEAATLAFVPTVAVTARAAATAAVHTAAAWPRTG